MKSLLWGSMYGMTAKQLILLKVYFKEGVKCNKLEMPKVSHSEMVATVLNLLL